MCFQLVKQIAKSPKQMTVRNSKMKCRKDVRIQSRNHHLLHLENVRILRKNLVFVSGIPSHIANNQLLKSNMYFGKYGNVEKVATNPSQTNRKSSKYLAYVTYRNPLDAAIAITALDGFMIDDRGLKVSLGTTKYCTFFLRGIDCVNSDCIYLHQFDKKNEVFTKDSKRIFQKQNELAIDLVYDNLDEIVQRIKESQQDNQQGFPSLMEMIKFLFNSNIISDSQFQCIQQNCRQSKLIKLTFADSQLFPFTDKINSPKQNILKLNKSNSSSTIASPEKLQLEKDKNEIEQIGNIQIENINVTNKVTKQQQYKFGQSITQKMQKKNEKMKLQQVEKNRVNNIKDQQEKQTQLMIQKKFLKNILKINEKSKSKLDSIGNTQWPEMQRIRQIIQKHLIIPN